VWITNQGADRDVVILPSGVHFNDMHFIRAADRVMIGDQLMVDGAGPARIAAGHRIPVVLDVISGVSVTEFMRLQFDFRTSGSIAGVTVSLKDVPVK
jgi:hypothetical protein